MSKSIIHSGEAVNIRRNELEYNVKAGDIKTWFRYGKLGEIQPGSLRNINIVTGG